MCLSNSIQYIYIHVHVYNCIYISVYQKVQKEYFTTRTCDVIPSYELQFRFIVNTRSTCYTEH